jgi:lysophospholipase L1-like esterase
LVLLSSTVLALAVAELLTRLLVPDPALRFENDIGLFQEDALVGYRNKPGFHGYAHGFLPVDTNSMGYRGPDVTLEKPGDTFRILGLGDSVMWGVGVPDDATYLRQLEGLMNKQRGPGRDEHTQVINTAVVGYSLYQELLTLQRDGVALKPNLVLVGFVPNDFYPTEDPFFNIHTFHEPRKEHVQRRVYPPESPGWSYFYRFARTQARIFRDRWYARLAAPEGTGQDDDDWAADGFEARNWPVLQRHFLAMQRLANERGFRLVILLFPTSNQVEAQRHAPQERISAFLSSAGIEHLDLFDVYRGEANTAFQDLMHLTPLGHRLTAEAILHYLDTHPGAQDTPASRAVAAAASPPGLGGQTDGGDAPR